jgi:hypothetical protein
VKRLPVTVVIEPTAPGLGQDALIAVLTRLIDEATQQPTQTKSRGADTLPAH